jgi:predicted component of type VI protein secretion system
MNLTLTIVQGPPCGGPATRSFEGTALGTRGLTLGRQPDNDWVLPNDTSVSRWHCKIVYEEGGFALVDTSSFGSAVNERRLGRGEQAPLHEGDRIALGEYAFAVSIDAAESPYSARPGRPELQRAFPELEHDPLDPFGPSSQIGDPPRQSDLNVV